MSREEPRPGAMSNAEFAHGLGVLLERPEANMFHVRIVPQAVGLPDGTQVFCFQDQTDTSLTRLVHSQALDGKLTSHTFYETDTLNWGIYRTFKPVWLSIRSSYAVVYSPLGNNGNGTAAVYDIAPQGQIEMGTQPGEFDATNKQMIDTIMGTEQFTPTAIPGAVRDPLIVAEYEKSEKAKHRGILRDFKEINPTIEMSVDLQNPETRIIDVAVKEDLYTITVAGRNKRRLTVPHGDMFVAIQEDEGNHFVNALEETQLLDYISTEENPTKYRFVLFGKNLTHLYQRTALLEEIRTRGGRRPGSAIITTYMIPNDPSHGDKARLTIEDVSLREYTPHESYTEDFIKRHLTGPQGEQIMDSIFRELHPHEQEPEVILLKNIERALQRGADEVFEDLGQQQPLASGLREVYEFVKKHAVRQRTAPGQLYD